MSLNLPTQQIRVCDGTADLSKPSRGSSLKAKDAKVAAAQKEREAAKVKKNPAPESEGEAVGDKLRADILLRDKLQCVLCPARSGLEVHHITPRSQGGRAVEENLCTLCRKCNNGIGARRLEILRKIGHAIDPKAFEPKVQEVIAKGKKNKPGA